MTCKADLIVPGTRVIVTNEAGYQFGPLILTIEPGNLSGSLSLSNGEILEIADIPKRYHGGEQVVRVYYKNQSLYCHFTHIRRQTTPWA